MLSMEYSPSQVLPKIECSQGRRKREGKAGEEKAGQAPDQVGLGNSQGLLCFHADGWAVLHK